MRACLIYCPVLYCLFQPSGPCAMVESLAVDYLQGVDECWLEQDQDKERVRLEWSPSRLPGLSPIASLSKAITHGNSPPFISAPCSSPPRHKDATCSRGSPSCHDIAWWVCQQWSQFVCHLLYLMHPVLLSGFLPLPVPWRTPKMEGR